MYQFIVKIIKEDNFLSLTGNLIIAVFGLAGFALLTRTLEPEEFAQWVLFIAGGSLVEMLRFGITNNGLVRFLSGAPKRNRDKLIGSNVLISIVATIIIVMILVGSNLIFNEEIDNSGYALFFRWYPVLAFLNLPWNNAIVVLYAKMDYGKILFIKSVNSVLFFLFLIINTIVLKLTVTEIVWVFIAVNSTTSIVCIVKAWDGLKFIRKAKRSTNKTLLNFGKYSTFTLIGTNLLRNADILIISISPLGSAAVALFSIPLKLTELQQIPLRSFAATAFPKMSKASLEGKVKEVQNLFHTYSGALTYLFLFISTITFVFAEEFVILISGLQYLNPETTGFDIVTLVRILSVYGLLLPIDRMTGIGLDSINRPNINALKVIVMLTTNVIGDLIAVYIFNSLEMVAVSTIVFTLVGICLGGYFLNREVRISSSEIFKSGNRFYKTLWNRSNVFNVEFKGFKN
jgi:O-antigen/teichoic acid export membrane protein